VNDVLVVHGFSIGYKADLQAQDVSRGLGGFFCAEVVTWAQVSGVNPNVYSSEETGRLGISR